MILVELGLWNEDMKHELMGANGSIQNIDGIPDDLKELYKTVWEMSMKDIIDMSRQRGYLLISPNLLTYSWKVLQCLN